MLGAALPASTANDLLARCGGCAGPTEGLEIVHDKKGSRGLLCGFCKTEYAEKLTPDSPSNFWMCGACNYRVLAGTRADIMVDENHNRCPNCSADVNLSLVNLSNDEPVGSDMFGSPLG